MSKKISELTAKTVFNDTDLVLISTDNGATFSSEKTTIADLRTALVGVQPKRYKARLFQEEFIYSTSGYLEVGKRYMVQGDVVAGDNFSNVGYVANGVTFTATNTTPINWTHGTVIIDVDASTPIVIQLENTFNDSINVELNYNFTTKFVSNSNEFTTDGKTIATCLIEVPRMFISNGRYYEFDANKYTNRINMICEHGGGQVTINELTYGLGLVVLIEVYE